jgi:hypothetical protein
MKKSFAIDELCGQILETVHHPLSAYFARHLRPVDESSIRARFWRSSNIAQGYNKYAPSYVMKFITQA